MRDEIQFTLWRNFGMIGSFVIGFKVMATVTAWLAGEGVIFWR